MKPAAAYFLGDRDRRGRLPVRVIPAQQNRWRWERGIAAALIALILAFQAWTALGIGPHPLFGDRQNDNYSQLLHSFLHGHLYLPTQPDPRLLSAADPYDPAKRPPGISAHDISYFRGHFYLYFGASPVVTLLLPWRLVTGHDLPQPYAILLFTGAGFIAASCLWLALRRRYFPESGWIALAAGIAVLGLASMLHAVLRRTGMWEAAIAPGYCFSMLMLCCLYGSLRGNRPRLWLAGAGACFALAVGARPTYAAGGAALLVPAIGAWWRERGAPGRPWLRPLLAVALGAAPVIAAILWYNAARFGNPFEFGQRYEINAADEYAARHFSLTYLPFNAYVYLLAPAHWFRYFPFVQVIQAPPRPPGHYGIEYVYGILTNLPFAWLALAVPLAWRGRRRAEEREALRAFAGAVFLLCLGTGLLVGCWWAATARYMVDFVPPVMLLAAIGMLGLERTVRERARTAALLAVAAAAAFSCFVGTMFSFQLHELLRQLAPDSFARVARAFDRPVAGFERAAGQRFGDRELTVWFPAGHPGLMEPLVTTGWEFYSDHLLVEYLDAGRLRFGFDHLSHGLVWSRPMLVDRGVPHVLRIGMGSFFPPRAHPYFEGMSPQQIDARAGHLMLVLDGAVVFNRPAEFYDSAPGGVVLGRDPDAFYGARFTGGIAAVRLLAPFSALPIDRGYGAVDLDLAFPAELPAAGAPLVATGVPGRGDVLLVRPAGPGLVRFAYDHMAGGFWESVPVAVGSAVHRLRVRLPSLLGAPATPEARALHGSLDLELDGEPVWAQAVPASPANPGQIWIGDNAVGASSCVESFLWPMARVERQSVAVAPASSGPVRLRVQFRGVAGDCDPLVVTGTPGRADLVSVRYLEDGRIRFRWDHWAGELRESPSIRADFARPHAVEVRMPTLEAGAAGMGSVRGELIVLLDGAEVWRIPGSFFRAAPDSLEIGENRIGGSTCDPAFRGGIIAAERTGR